MASIGHVLVGAAVARGDGAGEGTARPSSSAVGLWACLSLLPDVDVVGFAFGVRYEDPWGHRGATHSFAFAVLVALAVWMLARARRLPARRMALLALAVVASHPLLDTLTDGGLGCALL